MSYQKVNHGYLITGNLLDKTTGESYDLTGQILDVMVKKDYIENSFPLYVIDFKTTQEIRDIMRDNEVSVSLRIAYYDADDIETDEEIDTKEVTEKGVVFEGILRIYDKPYPTTTSKVEEENKDAEDQINSVPFVYYRMSGIPEDLISKNEESMNAIYNNCELVDVAIHMLTSVDTSSNIFIEEPVNRKVEEQIFIPPVGLIPAIKYLDLNYDYLYEHEASIFIDNNGIFIFDPFSNNPLKTNIIECNVLSPQVTSDITEIQHPLLDENNNIKLSYRNLPSFNKSKEITNHTVGSDTILYYYDDFFNFVSRYENQDSFKKVRYLWGNIGNKNYELLKKSEAMAINLLDINPEIVNPLTLFRLISSEYPQAEGDYIVGSLNYSFNSNDMIHFRSNSIISLLKK